jgi:syntaxin-binding protein 1
LVVDNYTKTLLNNVLKMYDVLQQNVSTVENIEMQRQPQTTFEAAYLLCPTSQNVDRIIQDLAPSGGRPPQYAAGHIFFVDSLANPLIERLTTSPAEPKLRQLIELYTNFWPTEAQVFSLRSPRQFSTLFHPIGGAYGPDMAEAAMAVEEELHFTAQTLLNVCVTLNEFPLIRYYNPAHPPLGAAAAPGPSSRQGRGRPGGGAEGAGVDHFTKRLAMRLQHDIDTYVRENEPKVETSRPRGILFITDRTIDTVAPLLHEFSYQAMCHDLLPISEDNKYKYSFVNHEGKREDKDATLSDDDAVWQAIRHLHIAEAIDKLSRDFKQHAGEAGQFANNASSLNDMRDMLASLPHMQEMKDKLSLHLTMAQNCMNKFEQSRLPAQAMVEQNCATRTTSEGQKPRTLVEEMVPLLDDHEVSNADKVRIIALYIMYSDGVPDEDRRRLFQHARLGLSEMDAVNNLVHLGARVVRDATSSGWDAWFKKGKRKQVPGENEYELSRYQPLLKLTIEDHFAGRLDTSTYPYVRDAPPESISGGVSSVVGGASGLVSSVAKVTGGGASMATPPRAQASSLRSAKPTWHQKGRQAGGTGGSGSGTGSFGSMGGLDTSRQRIIVFVAGGMTYSEIRSAYQLSDRLGRDVYIGSSHVFTPNGFIDALKSFGKASNYNGSTANSSAGASRLSAPLNEVSGIRTQANRAIRGANNGDQHHSFNYQARQPTLRSNSSRSGGSGGGHSSYEQDPEANQGMYDRRFQGQDRESGRQRGDGSYRGAPAPPPHSYGDGGLIPSRGASSAAKGAHNGGYGNHLNANSGMSAALRSTSPAPSSTSSAMSKEKKRLKNPFSFGSKK